MNRWPISYVSHYFGPRRIITTTYGTTKPFHYGIDIVATERTPINSWRDGKIEYISGEGGFGNHILIMHDHNYHSLYAHLFSLPDWEIGTSVTTDTIIGEIGNTGKSLGAHLHFEIWRYRKPVDPMQFFEEFIRT